MDKPMIVFDLLRKNLRSSSFFCPPMAVLVIFQSLCSCLHTVTHNRKDINIGNLALMVVAEAENHWKFPWFSMVENTHCKGNHFVDYLSKKGCAVNIHSRFQTMLFAEFINVQIPRVSVHMTFSF
ncbi:hypothetical protein Peur_012358 [Populus x canadensis]